MKKAKFKRLQRLMHKVDVLLDSEAVNEYMEEPEYAPADIARTARGERIFDALHVLSKLYRSVYEIDKQELR